MFPVYCTYVYQTNNYNFTTLNYKTVKLKVTSQKNVYYIFLECAGLSFHTTKILIKLINISYTFRYAYLMTKNIIFRYKKYICLFHNIPYSTGILSIILFAKRKLVNL